MISLGPKAGPIGRGISVRRLSRSQSHSHAWLMRRLVARVTPEARVGGQTVDMGADGNGFSS